MSGMLTCILTTTVSQQRVRSSGAQRGSLVGEGAPAGSGSSVRPAAAPAVKLQETDQAWRRAARAKHAGAAARSAAPGPAAGLLGRRLPLSGPRRRQPGIEPGPPPRSCSEGGARTAAAAFCGRVTSRTLRHAAPPGASPRAARAFPSARGRRYFQRSRVIGLGVVFSG